MNPNPKDTTNPNVVEALATLMKNSGRDVYIGEAGAASMRNIDTSINGYVCRTKNAETLQAIQDDIFKETGYDDLSQRTGTPLVNLHVGNMVKMQMVDNFVFKEIYVHKAMSDVDTFKWAWKAGMYPSALNDIQVVGDKIETVRQQFKKPQVIPYTMIADWYGPPCS